jgi:hypothetical protein
MSFGESIFFAGFIQKTIKMDLHVRINHAYPPRNGHQKVPKDSRGHHTKAGAKVLLGGAGRPHLYATWPLGPAVILHLIMSVSHRP